MRCLYHNRSDPLAKKLVGTGSDHVLRVVRAGFKNADPSFAYLCVQYEKVVHKGLSERVCLSLQKGWIF